MCWVLRTHLRRDHLCSKETGQERRKRTQRAVTKPRAWGSSVAEVGWTPGSLTIPFQSFLHYDYGFSWQKAPKAEKAFAR